MPNMPGPPIVIWAPTLAWDGSLGLAFYDQIQGVYRNLDIGDVIPTGQQPPTDAVEMVVHVGDNPT